MPERGMCHRKRHNGCQTNDSRRWGVNHGFSGAKRTGNRNQSINNQMFWINLIKTTTSFDVKYQIRIKWVDVANIGNFWSTNELNIALSDEWDDTGDEEEDEIHQNFGKRDTSQENAVGRDEKVLCLRFDWNCVWSLSSSKYPRSRSFDLLFLLGKF